MNVWIATSSFVTLTNILLILVTAPQKFLDIGRESQRHQVSKEVSTATTIVIYTVYICI